LVDHSTDRLGDPAFGTDGYHLTALSAAIDRGEPAGVTMDIDGDIRPLGARADIGADEFNGQPLNWVEVYLPLTCRVR
jgi:hypothetical protein